MPKLIQLNKTSRRDFMNLLVQDLSSMYKNIEITLSYWNRNGKPQVSVTAIGLDRIVKMRRVEKQVLHAIETAKGLYDSKDKKVWEKLLREHTTNVYDQLYHMEYIRVLKHILVKRKAFTFGRFVLMVAHFENTGIGNRCPDNDTPSDKISQYIAALYDKIDKKILEAALFGQKANTCKEFYNLVKTDTIKHINKIIAEVKEGGKHEN